MAIEAQDHRAAPAPAPSAQTRSLRNFYALRAAVAAVWVVAAFSVGKASPVAGAALLVAYPAWDALANLIDAVRNGGLGRNRTQAINVAVSLVAAVAMLAVVAGPNLGVRVFGAWAVLAGLLQLATGLRRWKAYGAQWVMILSGAQSMLAGGFFMVKSFGAARLGIADVAGYAGLGALYFLISALWLTFRRGASRAA